MTYTAIPAMTIKEAHSRITEHFAKEGARFGRPVVSKGFASCAYRGTDSEGIHQADSPIRCGVGVLIPDEFYDPYMDSPGDMDGAIDSIARAVRDDETYIYDSERDEQIEEGENIFPEFAEWEKDKGFMQFLSDIQALHDSFGNKLTSAQIGSPVEAELMDQFRDRLANMNLTVYR